MRVHEIRELSNDQLYEELEKAGRELMNLRFSAATNQLTNTNEPNSVKKTIARLQTIIKERQIQEAG